MEQKFCTECGYALKPGDKFCLRCGEKTEYGLSCEAARRAEPHASDSHASDPHASDPCRTEIPRAGTNSYGTPSYGSPRPKPPKKNKAWLYVLVACLTVCFVIGVALGVEDAGSSSGKREESSRAVAPELSYCTDYTEYPTLSRDWGSAETESETEVEVEESDTYSYESVTFPEESSEPETEESQSSIPAEWQGHYFLRAKDMGKCETLSGGVMVTFVYLDDTESSWTESAVAQAESEMIAQLQDILADAEDYGIGVDLSYLSFGAAVDAVATYENPAVWKDKAAQALGYGSIAEMQDAMERDYGVNAAPIVFVLNKDGRAYANFATSRNTVESAVVYSHDLESLRHELYHLFGVEDYYFFTELETAANTYLPNSVMVDARDGETDAFTAFCLGWLDTLTDSAEGFLQATADMTEAYIEQKRADDQYTGYVVRDLGGGVTYEGYFVMGTAHGQGTMTWADGSKYVGEFQNGYRTGYGVLYLPNGDRYEGEFYNGVLQGYGTYYWADGSSWAGYWENGEQVT